MTPKFERKRVSEKENQKSTPRTNVRFSPKPSPWNNEPPREEKSPFTEVQKLKQIPRGKPMVPQKQKKVLKVTLQCQWFVFPPYGKGINFVCMAWILPNHSFLKPLTIN